MSQSNMDNRSEGFSAPVAHHNEWNPYTHYQGNLIWSQYELQKLLHAYGKQEKETLLMLFPDRTWQAIRTKASRLKISSLMWTKEEDQLLMEMIDFGLNYKAMTNFLRHRSYYSIRSRGALLKRRLKK